MTVNAQNKITLDEAITLAFKNNIELQNHNAIIKSAQIALDESSRLPNPLFSYTREDLKYNSLKYDEWTASGSIPINFLWDRWSNLESKEKYLDAQDILLDQKRIDIIANVSINYHALNNYSDLTKSLNKTLLSLSELVQSSKDRLEQGDISEYELNRILLEINKLEVTTADIELKKFNFENKLKLLIGITASDSLLTDLSTMNNDIDKTREELIKVALNCRNDLKSLELIQDSEKLNLSHNKLKLIPNINLSAGYKEQLDNLSGSVFQIDFEIPLFNRNQMAIDQSENSLSLLQKEILFAKEKIKSDVSEAYSNFRIAKRLFQGRRDNQFEDILNVAIYSYQQGEITVVEFIDGINAFIEGSIMNKEVELNYNTSFYELEKAVGVSLKDFKQD
jgi:cobalt-zinc-cadmium efflux system outer membrane protein